MRRTNLKSAVEIEDYVFSGCYNLESVEFGDKLEIIGYYAFGHCTPLTHLKLPSVITIGAAAFDNGKLKYVEFSERLETVGYNAFDSCSRLQRIAVPLKRDLFECYDNDELKYRYTQFDCCDQLSSVDLVGGIHKTAASLHMESWRTDMEEEINRINPVLPSTDRRDRQ